MALTLVILGLILFVGSFALLFWDMKSRIYRNNMIYWFLGCLIAGIALFTIGAILMDEKAKTACEKSGGTYTKTGEYTYFAKVGDALIPMTGDEYSCIKKEK